MPRIQISLEPEMERRARRRADDLGVSLAEYLGRLISRDLGRTRPAVSATTVFDLGASIGSDIGRKKTAMLAEAFAPGIGSQSDDFSFRPE